MANKEIASRVRKASSMMAVAARRNKPELDRQARRLSGIAHIENQILLHQGLLTDDDRTALAQILFSVETPDSPADINTPVNTPVNTPAASAWDPDNEEEEEEE